jgi:hypothetical protein
VVVAVGAALSWFSLGTLAQEGTNAPQSMAAPASGLSPADLERAFWICDYAATTRPIDAGSAIFCTAVTEDLQKKKFNGDFDAMLAWWQQYKPAEHEALEAADAARVALPTSSIIPR